MAANETRRDVARHEEHLQEYRAKLRAAFLEGLGLASKGPDAEIRQLLARPLAPGALELSLGEEYIALKTLALLRAAGVIGSPR